MRMQRSGERGSATLKFVIVMALMGATAYAGYLYVPVAFQANAFKDLMQHYADVAATQGYPPSWLSEQLMKNGAEYGLPSDAIITPAKRNNRLEVRVQFVRVIDFPGYPYNYEFDHTVKSTAFLTFK
jgi:anaerobic selenocysteine-containing dehydrogenase